MGAHIIYNFILRYSGNCSMRTIKTMVDWELLSDVSLTWAIFTNLYWSNSDITQSQVAKLSMNSTLMTPNNEVNVQTWHDTLHNFTMWCLYHKVALLPCFHLLTKSLWVSLVCDWWEGRPAEMEVLSFVLALITPHLAQMKLKLCVGIVRSVM